MADVVALYRAEHEHHSGVVFGRVFENCAPGKPTVSTGEFIWVAWRATGQAKSGVASDRYAAEDAVELAMDELAVRSRPAASGDQA